MNKLIKITLLGLTFLLFPNLSFSQSSSKEITGQIIDSHQKAIEGALIWLITPNSQQPIAQAITEENGIFHLACVSKKVKLVVNCLGYHRYTSPLFQASQHKDFKCITLTESVTSLKDITITGKKFRPIIAQKAGKQIFNVENSINAQGSNAYDLLKLVPGVNVNDGNHSITLNGKNNVLIMLNGKPTYMQHEEVVNLLKSTTSSQIKSIEIMANAPAQYDAAGSGGILNIVLKKEKKEGYNLTLNTGLSYWFNLKQNTAVHFNYHHKKINLYGNYSHILGYTRFVYGGKRQQYSKFFKADSDDTDKRNTASGALGIDIELDTKHQLGFRFSGNSVFGPGIIQTINKIYTSSQQNELLYSITSESDYYHQTANSYNVNINYCYELSNRRKLMLDMDYNRFRSDQRVYQPNTYYSSSHQVDSIANYRTLSKRNIDLYAINASYEEKIGKGKLMTGVKWVAISSNNEYHLYNIEAQKDQLDTTLSNDFEYNENILAGFLLYDFSWKKNWHINMGCRLEYTHSKGHLFPPTGSTTQESLVKRDYVDFFPSIGIVYKPTELQSIGLSYGKRIDRPAYSDLNPIKQPLDGLTSWKGNPFLEPQKSHRIALNYNYRNTSAEISYAKTNDYRVGIIELEGEDKTASIPKNLGTQCYWGLSLSQSLRLFKAWDINFSGTVYHLDNKLTYNNSRFYHRKRWAGNCSLQTTFPLFWEIQSEISGVYASKRLGGSTDIMNMNGSLNIGFQKKFMEGKLITKIAITDIFWDTNWDSENHFDHYDGKNYGYLESRMIKLNITFKLGKSKKTNQKKSQIQTEINRI
jgi:outer membrane receptor protein involved in Fe transport